MSFPLTYKNLLISGAFGR